jgi:hypothetical protein
LIDGGAFLPMKTILALFGAVALSAAYFGAQPAKAESSCCDHENAACSPTGVCTACKNCSSCKHCKGGGTCSVCKKKDDK